MITISDKSLYYELLREFLGFARKNLLLSPKDTELFEFTKWAKCTYGITVLSNSMELHFEDDEDYSIFVLKR